MKRTTTRKATASPSPEPIATGRLRLSLTPIDEPADGGRCGVEPRRTGSGRRGIPDGSVPIVMRGGSRRDASATTASVAAVVPGPSSAPGASATAGSAASSGSFSQLSSPVGSDGLDADCAESVVLLVKVPEGSSTLSPSFHTGDSEVNVDHTSRSSESPPSVDAASILGISPVGGSVQCGSGPVVSLPKLNPEFSIVGEPEPSPPESSPNSGPPNSSSSNSSIDDSN